MRPRVLIALGCFLLAACASVTPSQTPATVAPPVASVSAVGPASSVAPAGPSGSTASSTPRPPLSTPSEPISSGDSDGDGLSNAWETRWGLTDPAKRDSNGNGVLDSAEDPDGDGLSNLGEQRFGTNPGLADSNGNGIPDNLDDSNGDGIPDGLEQDHRPVPGNLKPSLADAPNDKPVSYINGCHTFQGSTAIHPCVFGDPAGATTVVVFGDSHALQWVPGLDRAAKVEHWRLVAITKSGCPSVDVLFDSRAFPNDRVPCQRWRQRAIAWLDAHVPDVLIVANSRGYTVVDGQGHTVPRDPAWGAGLARTLSALPMAAHRIVLGDTPHLSIDPPTCLAAHLRDISACETSRGLAENRKHDDVERTTAEANGASFVSLNALVCSYDPCPVLAGNVVMWRNTSHLTATWVPALWPSLAAVVIAAMAPAAMAPAAMAPAMHLVVALEPPRGEDDFTCCASYVHRPHA